MKDVLKKLKKKSSLSLLVYIGLALILVGGSSFAYINYTIEANETNLVKSGCFEISYEQKNNINLVNQVPMTDEEGMGLIPYNFTITNSCNIEAYYETTFNVLTTSGIGNDSKVKLYLTGDNYISPSLVSSFRTVELIDKPNDVKTSYLIDSGYLKQGERKTFNLRMWIDYDVTNFDGSFDSKVIVTSVAEKGPMFEELTTGYQVMAKNGVSLTTILNPNFESVSPSVTSQTTGLYKMQGINNHYTYYFRGNPDNYFKFGKYAENTTVTYKNSNGETVTQSHQKDEDIVWRILRINEDGSLKLILNDFIGTSAFNSDTSIKYFEDSLVKTSIENFYNKHLVSDEEYIVNTNFCLNKNYKMINNINYYSSYTRNVFDKTPMLSCDEDDLYVGKIGLISADELAVAGNVYSVESEDNYLYKNTNGWWTLSPASLPNNELSNIVSRTNKSIDVEKVTTELSVRPVISIGSNYLLTGNGTLNNPYKIDSAIEEPKVLTLDLDGGSYSNNTSPSFRLIEGENFYLETPIKEGYDFTHWTIENGEGRVQGNNFIMGSTDTVIKANWEISERTLTLNLDGGTTTGNTSIKIKKGESVTLAVPSKTNYTFAGWDVSGTDLTTTGNSITMGQNNATAIAKWVQTVTTFDYTGSAPTTPYTAIPGSYQLEVYGAQGGGYSSGVGGNGAYTKGILTLTEDTDLYVYVGGAGTYSSSTGISSGGFNGGGNSAYCTYAGSGGGATDIRINNTGTSYRVIVAGGGGGGGYYSSSYYGTGGTGGSSGGAGYNEYYSSSTASYGCGQGASSTAGGSYGYYSSATYGGSTGSFGAGGAASTATSTYSCGGGGGGGWYGGGGAGYRSSSTYYKRYICGGGGGSSFALTTSNSNSSLTSEYYLTSTSFTAGSRSGNGTATITVVSINY